MSKRAAGDSTPKPTKKTRILEPEDDPATFAEQVDSALENRGRRGRVKEEGYDSDSTDDGEGVVYSRRKDGQDEDDMFAVGGDGDKQQETKKKKEYLRLGDIEGQEFNDKAGSSEDESEDEPEDEDDAERRKKAGMGYELSSFNMREELEEGKFTADGSYVRSVDQHAMHDRWMEGVDEKAIKLARQRKKRQDKIQREKQEAEEMELETSGGKSGQELQLLAMLKKGETTVEALQRLGKTKMKSDIERLTHLASNIMSLGEIDIYNKTYEEIVRDVRASGNVDSSWIPPSADRQYEYRWIDQEEVFGPFSEDEMRTWHQASYFGEDGEKVQVRETGGIWSNWGDVL